MENYFPPKPMLLIAFIAVLISTCKDNSSSPDPELEIYMIRPDETDLTLITRETFRGGGMNPSLIKIQEQSN